MFQGGSLWGGLISGGVSQFQDTLHLTNGRMDRKQYMTNTTRNVTGALGVMAGVEYGAVLGTSIFPGVGTAVGAVVGGFLGDRIGRTVGVQAGNIILNNSMVENALQQVWHPAATAENKEQE